MSRTVFYDRFARHSHGEGLKGQSTHYCAGCGHGLAHKYLAEAIEALGIQNQTVAISPVGCSVFLYYYFDVGNTQAAHGRAPAVAIGHKLANPESIVISYQGDGDLASIGLAEIVATAQLGVPITVIFVNNAIYGMTGGQMAPTTLMEQKTSSSPYGRDIYMGQPIKMAELIAGLDGPVYVERVALFDAKQRNRARKAIRRGLQLQVEKRGFSFIEVLAECPTHLKLTPAASEVWVREQMLPVYPLGVKKDQVREPWFTPPRPDYEAGTLLGLIGGSTDAPPRFCESYPSHIAARDISLKLAGAGGDGAQTAAMLIALAGINEGFDATHIPSYGPESRGGTSYADVHVAADEVLSPASPHPHVLVAFNAPSLTKFADTVHAGGTIIYDSSVIDAPPPIPSGVAVFGIPMTRIATDLGKPLVKNIVALGALQAATGIFPAATFLTAIRGALKDKCAMIPLNEAAFEGGATRSHSARCHSPPRPTTPRRPSASRSAPRCRGTACRVKTFRRRASSAPTSPGCSRRWTTPPLRSADGVRSPEEGPYNDGTAMLRVVFLLVGVGVFGYLFVQLGPAAVLAMLGRIGWGAVPIGCAYAAFQCFRALALSASVAGGRSLRFRDALWIRLSGEAIQFLTFTGPFLAEPAKALLLKRRGLTTGEGFAATLTEYLAYTLTGSTLSIAVLGWLLADDALTGGARQAALVILAVMTAFVLSSAIAITRRVYLLGGILERVARLPLVRRRLRPNMTDVHHVEDLLLGVMHDRPWRFARVLLLESGSHSLHILELYLILRALELGTGPVTAVLIEGATKFIGVAFFFIPGQVGASEGAHSIIFEVIGLPAVAGFTVPFVRRIRGVVVAAAGLLAMSLLTRQRAGTRPVEYRPRDGD